MSRMKVLQMQIALGTTRTLRVDGTLGQAWSHWYTVNKSADSHTFRVIGVRETLMNLSFRYLELSAATYFLSCGFDEVCSNTFH